MIKDLLDDLLKATNKNEAAKVCKVYLKMGEFTEINPEILKHYFVVLVKRSNFRPNRRFLENLGEIILVQDLIL